ncbi:DMT family transporter [Actinocorallia longicatena]|uniref:DMT family transporter n=2 Tax=Actinocorallia longicatena TaxID=111803 RepID=A0ABP6Q1B2_9ACTN
MTRAAAPGGLRGVLGATGGMTLVGTLAAISATIGRYPVFSGQALRYALAAAILLPLAARQRSRAAGPLGVRDLFLLLALTATGLAGFNYCLVEAARHADPATVATVVGGAPVVMAFAGPLVAGHRPSLRVLLGALLVAGGAGLANGVGGGSAEGFAYAAGALAGELLFSLLALPLLPKLGPVRLSAYCTALAVPMLAALAVIAGESPRVPTAGEGAAIVYAGVVITVVAFLLWYDALGRLGPDRASLFAGVIPISAAVTTMVLGLGVPSGATLAGCLLVAAGVTYGTTLGGGQDYRKKDDDA